MMNINTVLFYLGCVIILISSFGFGYALSQEDYSMATLCVLSILYGFLVKQDASKGDSE